MSRYTVNDSHAALELYVGGVVVTTYNLEFETEVVTLSARPSQTVLTIEEYVTNVGEILRWVRMVNMNRPLHSERGEFSSELTRKSDRVEMLYKKGTLTVTNADYKQSTGEVKFNPRSEIVMNWGDFDNWANALNAFLMEIQHFKMT